MITKITDHVQRALSALPSQHAEQPNIEKFITAFAEMVQVTEDGMYPLLLDLLIDDAEGAQLDILGRVVGQERSGLSDTQYRIRLKARVATTRSRGTVADLLKIVSLLLLPDVALVELTNLFPASVLLDVRDLPVTAEMTAVVAEFMRDAAAAGVQVHVVTSASPDSETFYTSRSAYLLANHSAGVSLLIVDSVDGFPTAGSLTLDTGLATQETVNYFQTAPFLFQLSAPTSNAHAENTDCSLVGSRGLGIGNTDDPLVGGKLATVEES